MKSPEPWHNEKTDGNESILGPSLIRDVENYVVAEGLWTKDAERIIACVNFCAGYSNEELNAMNRSLKGYTLIKEAQVTQANGMMLEIRDECVAANRLVAAMFQDWGKTFPDSFEYEAVEMYLKKKGLLNG